MKESFGGSWLFGIVILFIALFTSYLAYSINYTRAFNLKNKILEEIEKTEGYTKADGDVKTMSDQQLADDGSVEATVYQWIKRTGYASTNSEGIDCSTVDGHAATRAMPGGYCVTKYCRSLVDDNTHRGTFRTYYKVTTFVAFKIPIFNVTLKVPVTGETMSLYYDNEELPCQETID